MWREQSEEPERGEFRASARRAAASLAVAMLASLAGGCGGNSSGAAENAIAATQIEAAGFLFDARVAGPAAGPLVLLLHGFPESSYEWRAQLTALARAGYHAVAPDMRGYSPGARPIEVEAYRLEHLVGDAIAIADSLGADTFHVVGHDWGAAVAWELALLHPERTRSLTAISVPHPRAFLEALASDADQQQRSSYITFFQQPGIEQALLADDARLIRDAFGDGPIAEAVDYYVELLQQPGRLTAAVNYYRSFGQGVIALGPVAVPTLYIWSTGDFALGRVAAERTSAYVSGPYRLLVLDDASHWLPEDAPEEVSAALLEHLRRWEGHREQARAIVRDPAAGMAAP